MSDDPVRRAAASLVDTAFVADPYPAYRALREEGGALAPDIVETAIRLIDGLFAREAGRPPSLPTGRRPCPAACPHCPSPSIFREVST